MKKIIASLISLPVTFFITRFVNIACDMYLATLKAADPEFPHTTLQLMQKSALDAAFVLPILAFGLCSSWVWYCIFSHVEKRNAEAIRLKLEKQK